MARKPVKKKKKSPKIVQPKKRKQAILDPNVEEIYEETITFNCPQRGKVSQKVKVKRYKSRIIETPHIIGPEEDQMESLGEDADVSAEDAE